MLREVKLFIYCYISEFTKQLYEWFDEYGPSGTFRLSLGYHPITFICNPDEAEVSIKSGCVAGESW